MIITVLKNIRVYQWYRLLALKHPFMMYHAPVFLALGAIHYLSEAPGSAIPPLFQLSDTFLHAFGYMVLTTLVFRSHYWLKKDLTSSLLFAISYCILWGIVEECNQYSIPGRHFDLYDIIANCAGSVIGAPAPCVLSKHLDSMCTESNDRDTCNENS